MSARQQQRTGEQFTIRRLLALVVVLCLAANAVALRVMTAPEGGRSATDAEVAVVTGVAGLVAQEPHRSEMTVTMEVGDVESTFQLTEEVADPVRPLARVTVEFDLPDEASELGLPDRMTMIGDGTTAYATAEPLPSALVAAGRRWLRADATAELASTEPFLEPGHYLRMLEASSTRVVNLGRSAVRGVTTTRYQADVDPRRLALQQGRDEQALAGAEIRAEVWVDGLGRPHRVRMEMRSDGLRISVRVELSDYGGAFDVRVPDPADIHPGGTLTEALAVLGVPLPSTTG